MKINKSFRVLLGIFGACAIFGTAGANNSVGLSINGNSVSLGDEAWLDHGVVVAPVRSIVETMGGRVNWDKETHSVNIQTKITKDEVADWIRKQGKDKKDYYFDGLSIEEVNVDTDPEPEVLSRIDGGVHLGNFFIFDQQPDGSYQLIFERPWHVESWDLELFRAEGINPLYKIITRTGGTGMDVREAHLMYMSDHGKWTEAWNGKLKDRSVFQDQYHILMGGYQFNDDDGLLFYWTTEMDTSKENNNLAGDSRTTMKVFELQAGRFVEKEK